MQCHCKGWEGGGEKEEDSGVAGIMWGKSVPTLGRRIGEGRRFSYNWLWETGNKRYPALTDTGGFLGL